jgi:tRNA(adenine34) deaminase
MSPFDRDMMHAAIEQAREAAGWGDVPVGAAVIRGGQILGRAGNQREKRGDPTAHAEMLALRAAAEQVQGWRLDGCSMYVTLEPCAMCAGAVVLARLDRLVIGAMDPKAGFAGSLGDLVRDPRLNHAVQVETGVLADECGELLRDFFRGRR